MTSLLDIGPLTEEVTVNGSQVTVHGVTPEGFFYLLEKFPLLKKLFGGESQGVTMEMMVEIAPSSVAHAIAVATTSRVDFDSVKDWRKTVEKAAAVAVQLSAHHQMALFQVGLRLTFPDGIGPFMKGVEALANSINRVSGRTAPATTSSKPSRSGFVTDSLGLRLGPGAPRANSVH